MTFCKKKVSDTPGLNIPHICHGHHGRCPWRKICHVEKFQISIHDRCGEIWNFTTCGVILHDKCEEIWNFSTCELILHFSTWQMWRNLKSPSLSAICTVSLRNRFVAILSQKLCPWRKNDKYEVCTTVVHPSLTCYFRRLTLGCCQGDVYCLFLKNSK